MIYDAILEVKYRHSEGLTNVTNTFPDLKLSLWCNWSIDIIVVDTENLNQKNIFFTNMKDYLGEHDLVDSYSESGPVIVRPCKCPSSPVSTLLPEYDCFHISPIVYEQNKEVLHLMLSSTNTSDLFDKIKGIKDVEDISLKYLNPHKFPEKPFPIYLPINDLLSNLTEKQYEVFIEAFNKGYYELPRQISTEDLSKKFDFGRRALEDHLRKAERNIFNILVPFLLMNRLKKI